MGCIRSWDQGSLPGVPGKSFTIRGARCAPIPGARVRCATQACKEYIQNWRGVPGTRALCRVYSSKPTATPSIALESGF